MIDLSHFALLIANATTTYTTDLAPHAVQQLSNTDATLGVGGIATAIGGILGKVIYDRKTDKEVQNWGSDADIAILDDVIDNYRDFRDYLEIEKQIQDYAMLNKEKPYFEVLNIVVDVSTNETLGQRKAKFINNIIGYYESYYNRKTPGITTKSDNPVASTLAVIKEKTTPA